MRKMACSPILLVVPTSGGPLRTIHRVGSGQHKAHLKLWGGPVAPGVSNKLNAGFGISVGMYEHRSPAPTSMPGNSFLGPNSLTTVLPVGWVWPNGNVLGRIMIRCLAALLCVISFSASTLAEQWILWELERSW